MPKPGTAEVNGTTLEYVDIGEGEPVVIVHGAIAYLPAGADCSEPVSSFHRFIAYTRRFYGNQVWPEEAVYDFEQHAADLVALRKNLDTGPAHFVGWSSSGIILTYVAANHPWMVKSIVNCCNTISTSDFVPHWHETERLETSVVNREIG